MSQGETGGCRIALRVRRDFGFVPNVPKDPEMIRNLLRTLKHYGGFVSGVSSYFFESPVAARLQKKTCAHDSRPLRGRKNMWEIARKTLTENYFKNPVFFGEFRPLYLLSLRFNLKNPKYFRIKIKFSIIANLSFFWFANSKKISRTVRELANSFRRLCLYPPHLGARNAKKNFKIFFRKKYNF